MPFQICRHIRTNGRRCQSPSLTGNIWCYFHQPLHYRITKPSRKIKLTTLQDPLSIQASLAAIVNALATRQLETRRGAAILYALQLATSNAALAASMQEAEPAQSGFSPEARLSYGRGG